MNSKFLLMAILTAGNAIFMFISFSVYIGTANEQASNSAFSAFIAWGWLSIMLFKRYKDPS